MAESWRAGNGATAASIALAAVLSCVIVLAGLLAAYPSIDAAIRFLLYVLVFNFLPGMVVARLVLPGVDELGSYVVYALSMGIAVNLLIFLPLWMMGAPELLVMLPFAAAGALVVLRRRLRFGSLTIGPRSASRPWFWAAMVVLITATPLLTMQYLLSQDIDGVYAFHFGAEALVVQDLARGWPPPNLMLADTPLSYHYGAHLWLLAARQIAGIPVEILAGRLGPVFFTGCAAAQIMAFCRHVLRLRWWAAALPVVSVFWIVGIPALAGKILATFAALSGVLIMSPSLAYIVFFVAVTILCDALARRDRPGWNAVAVALLAFLLTGARAVGPPVLLCALALLWAVELWRGRRLPVRLSAYLLATVTGFAAGLLLFFRIGGTYDGMGFTSFTGEPFTRLTDPAEGIFVLPALLMARHVPRLLAGMVGFLVMVLGQAGFLLPTLAYDLRDMVRRGAGPSRILLLGASIAGIAAVFLIAAPGHSELSFLQYANICLSMMGAAGAQELVSGGWALLPRWKKAGKAAILLGTSLLLAVQLAQLPPSSLNWIFRGSGAKTKDFGADKDIAPVRSIASCVSPDDADLLRVAASSAVPPVVVLLPRGTNLAFRCEYAWWTVLHPVQTIQPYAVFYPPGRPSGALKTVLDRRSAAISALAKASSEGRLAVPELLSLADSFAPETPCFAIVARNLSYDATPRIHAIAHSERYLLIRIGP